MPANISSSVSRCINGYVLEGKGFGAKPDSHGRSIAVVYSCRKFKCDFSSVA